MGEGQELVVTTVAVNFNQFCCLFDKFFLFHRVVFSLHMVVGWTNGRVANGWWLNGCLPRWLTGWISRAMDNRWVVNIGYIFCVFRK